MSERRKRALTAAAVTACVVLHFYTSIRTFFENWYYSYTVWSWTFLGLWLLGLMALDIWLCFFGGAELLRSLKWYWGFSALVFAVFFLGVLLDYTTPPALFTALIVILMFLAPVNQCLAFSWLLFDQIAGLTGSARYNIWWGAGLLFCLIHFIYIAWLHHRARQRGETAHGPVDPGAGTVE